MSRIFARRNLSGIAWARRSRFEVRPRLSNNVLGVPALTPVTAGCHLVPFMVLRACTSQFLPTTDAKLACRPPRSRWTSISWPAGPVFFLHGLGIYRGLRPAVRCAGGPCLVIG